MYKWREEGREGKKNFHPLKGEGKKGEASGARGKVQYWDLATLGHVSTFHSQPLQREKRYIVAACNMTCDRNTWASRGGHVLLSTFLR